MEARPKKPLFRSSRILRPAGIVALALALQVGCTKVKVIEPETVATPAEQILPVPTPPVDVTRDGNSAVPSRGKGISIRASIGAPVAPLGAAAQRPVQTAAGVSFETTPFVPRK